MPYRKNICSIVKYIYICDMENAQVKNTERYEVKKRVRFGMLMGYYIFDNKELIETAHDFDEDELKLAQSKVGRLNAWLGND